MFWRLSYSTVSQLYATEAATKSVSTFMVAQHFKHSHSVKALLHNPYREHPSVYHFEVRVTSFMLIIFYKLREEVKKILEVKGKPLWKWDESAGSEPTWWGSARPTTLQGSASNWKVSFSLHFPNVKSSDRKVNFVHVQYENTPCNKNGPPSHAFGEMDDTNKEN